jgi:hypothetical protein
VLREVVVCLSDDTHEKDVERFRRRGRVQGGDGRIDDVRGSEIILIAALLWRRGLVLQLLWVNEARTGEAAPTRQHRTNSGVDLVYLP